MSLTPRLTLIGLYKYNPAVFANLTFPAAIDEEIFIDSLLLEYGECPLIYPDYDFMKLSIGAWCRKWYANFERIAAALNATYNPIHNYDKTETWTENETNENSRELTNNTDTTYSQDETTENQVSAYNESTYQPDSKNILDSDSTTNTDTSIEESENKERENTRTGRVYGNIGVTESSAMVQNELDLRTNQNLYHILSEMFYREFCLYVF